jgi:hypothetical protein
METLFVYGAMAEYVHIVCGRKSLAGQLQCERRKQARWMVRRFVHDTGRYISPEETMETD